MSVFAQLIKHLGVNRTIKNDLTSHTSNEISSVPLNPLYPDFPGASGRRSFSQLGEDGTLWWMFGKKPGGFYVDIGCHHPFYYSNTALLHHEHGWSGINVDIDERAIAAFRVARPNDTNIVAAVGLGGGSARVTIFEEAGALNYVGIPDKSRDHLAHRTTEMEIVSLASVLDRHVPALRDIDYLNIDAEGQDYDILCSNDWSRFRPTAISIETTRGDVSMTANHHSYAYLRGKGYELLSHHVCTSIYWLEKNDLDP